MARFIVVHNPWQDKGHKIVLNVDSVAYFATKNGERANSIIVFRDNGRDMDCKETVGELKERITNATDM